MDDTPMTTVPSVAPVSYVDPMATTSSVTTVTPVTTTSSVDPVTTTTPVSTTKTMQHLWLPLIVFGGLVEYPLYLSLGLQSNFMAMIIVYAVRKTLEYTLWAMKSNMRPSAQIVNFVDLPETPWWVQHPDNVLLPDPVAWKTTQFIQLLHPHGMFTEVGSLYGASRTYPPKTVLLIDPLLFNLSPICIPLIEYATVNLKVSFLKHANISTLLKSGHNIIVFVGGFDEALDFGDETESIHIDKYQYWMRMSRQYSTELWSTIYYDGSTRYFRQSSVAKEFRLKLAQRKIPIILPSGIRFPTDQTPVYTRHIKWDQRIHTNVEITEKISEVVNIDLSLQKSKHVIKCKL